MAAAWESFYVCWAKGIVSPCEGNFSEDMQDKAVWVVLTVCEITIIKR